MAIEFLRNRKIRIFKYYNFACINKDCCTNLWTLPQHRGLFKRWAYCHSIDRHYLLTLCRNAINERKNPAEADTPPVTAMQ